MNKTLSAAIANVLILQLADEQARAAGKEPNPMAAEQNNHAERRAMFAAFSECLVHGNSMTPTEIADTLLAARRSAAIGEGGLPELPEPYTPAHESEGCCWPDVFTEAQMRQYARDAVAADRRAREAVPQAAQGVKTWQERYNEMGTGPSFNDKSVAMMAEIADLRAQLARQSQSEPLAWRFKRKGDRFWQTTGDREVAASIGGAHVEIVPLYAAPPLSSEQHADGWKLIDTAPRDKMLLLAAEFDGPGDWRIKVGGHWDGKWNVFGASWAPTRWMPLPKPPVKGEPNVG
jgi:hypothetical protein